MKASIWVALAAVPALLACGSDPAAEGSGGVAGTVSTGGSAGSSSGGAGGAGATGGTGGGPTCNGPGLHASLSEFQIDSVSARVIDPSGAPIVDESIQVCGPSLCLKAVTNSLGNVVINPATPMLGAAFKVGLGLETAKYAYLLPEGATFAFGDFVNVRFPPYAQGVPMVSGQGATSAGVTITPPAGGRIKIDKLSFSDAEQQTFRAVKIPAGSAPIAVDPTLGLDVLYATTPVWTEFCPPAQVSLPNDLAWAPGTQVEIFIHGVELGEDYAPYGGWAKATDGSVSADGTQIVSAEGQGLSVLSILGVRQKT